jgi:hypothetical protein
MPAANKDNTERTNAVIYARYSPHGQTEQSIEGRSSATTTPLPSARAMRYLTGSSRA